MSSSSSETPSTSTHACACIKSSDLRAPKMILASMPSRQRIQRSTKDLSRHLALYKLRSAAIRTSRATASGGNARGSEGRPKCPESRCRCAILTNRHAMRTRGSRAAACARITISGSDNRKSFCKLDTSVVAIRCVRFSLCLSRQCSQLDNGPSRYSTNYLIRIDGSPSRIQVRRTSKSAVPFLACRTASPRVIE